MRWLKHSFVFLYTSLVRSFHAFPFFACGSTCLQSGTLGLFKLGRYPALGLPSPFRGPPHRKSRTKIIACSPTPTRFSTLDRLHSWAASPVRTSSSHASPDIRGIILQPIGVTPSTSGLSLQQQEQQQRQQRLSCCLRIGYVVAPAFSSASGPTISTSSGSTCSVPKATRRVRHRRGAARELEAAFASLIRSNLQRVLGKSLWHGQCAVCLGF